MKVKNCIPSTSAAWLAEIAKAYADARETIPVGRLVGQRIRCEDLFHLAPAICLKFRGIPRSKERLEQATMAALSSYVATKDDLEEVFSVPEMAFAFAYLASHFGLDLLTESEVNEIMEYIERNQAPLLDHVG